MRVGKPRRNHEGIVGTFLIPDDDLIRCEGYQPHSVDEITKDMASRGRGVPPADLRAQEAIEAAGPQRQRSVTGDLHGHG